MLTSSTAKWSSYAGSSNKKSQYGRPSLSPGVYFRCLLIGYFEGLDSERGIAWRSSDSLSLAQVSGLHAGGEDTGPLHHFAHAASVLAGNPQSGVQLGAEDSEQRRIDQRADRLGGGGHALEANAAMRNIVRRENGQSYND